MLNKLNIDTVASISFSTGRRSELSHIRKALPSRVLNAVDNPSTDIAAECVFYIPVMNIIKVFAKVTSKEITESIKIVLHKKIKYHPADKYQLDKSHFEDIRITWHNLWRIKNPTLRAIRLKILYKDVWCQDKRLKLGIATDNKCTICGEPETVLHQLFFCENAER